MDAASACASLEVSRSRLYQLRTGWLRDKDRYHPAPSGGDHGKLWPQPVHRFLEGFLPLQNPPNYQLVADELERLCGFHRARSSVEAYVKKHLAGLVPSPPRRVRPYRRFRCAHAGELWQHDSSIHQWWPDTAKQTLLLSADDHSRLIVAGRFVRTDTTWNHFCHFRGAFVEHGLPAAVYTDGLSLFGASSTDDTRDPRSEFQRALTALGVAHLVAPTPQAKGKIERRFGTFQKRMVTLLAHAGATAWAEADTILQMEIGRQNRTRCRTTGEVPQEAWDRSCASGRSLLQPAAPSSLLDLHFSLRCGRRVNHDNTVDFLGQNWELTPTSRRTVTLVHHPKSRFWIVEEPPKLIWPTVLGAYSL